MRIVDTDNFVLWEMREDCAKRIADALNDNEGPNAERFYKVVPNDYVLEPGFRP